MAETRNLLPGLRALVRRRMSGRPEREAEEARAREAQRALLPRNVPQAAEFAIGCVWREAAEASGNYFDAFALPGGRTGLCVSDVAGKGLEAVQVASQVCETVRQFAPESATPAELCTRVNQALSGTIPPANYVTLFYAVLESGGRVLYENAGHCQPLLVRAGGGVEFPPSLSGVVGIFSHWLYSDQEVRMRPGDTLLQLTEGLLNAKGRAGEAFGYRRLAAEAERRRGASGEELASEILAVVARFCGGRFREDAFLLTATMK